MKHITLQEKYPIFTIDIEKYETNYKNTQEIINFLKEKIDSHPVCTYIGEFDHFTHTKNLENGEIAPEIKDCKLIIFCFGNKLPNGKITAARPRSISVTEYENKFEISFLEAPAIMANEVMQSWIKELKKAQ